MYKIQNINGVTLINNYIDNSIIPLVNDNSDYVKFKTDVASGVELQDATGVKMTKTKVTAFLKTIP